MEGVGFREKWNKNSAPTKKLIWMMTSLTMLCMCLYQVTDRVQHFLNEPVVVNTFYTSDKSIQLPSITICPFLHREREGKLNFLQNLKWNGTKSSEEINELLKTRNITIEELINSTKELYSAIELEFLNPRNRTWQKNQDYDAIEEYSELAVCHTINPTKSITNYGAETIMRLTISYGRIHHLQFQISSHGRDDLFWQFKTRHFFSNYIRFTMNKVSLEIKERILRRNRKNNPCEEEKYVSECFLRCLKNYIFTIEPNLCRMPMTKNFGYLSPCRSRYEVLKTMQRIELLTLRFRPITCSCPKQCQEVVYPENYRQSDINRHNNANVIIDVVINDRMLLMQEEVSYSWFNLLCDVGGTLGLWLGICGLEIFEAAAHALSKVCLKFKGEQKTATFVSGLPRAVVVRCTSINKYEIPTIEFPALSQSLKKENPSMIRAFWLSLFMFTLGFGLFQATERISYYLCYTPSTTVYYLLKENVPYPVLTICPAETIEFLPVVNPSLIMHILGRNRMLNHTLELQQEKNMMMDSLWNMSRIVFTNASFQEVRKFSCMLTERLMSIVGEEVITAQAKPL